MKQPGPEEAQTLMHAGAAFVFACIGLCLTKGEKVPTAERGMRMRGIARDARMLADELIRELKDGPPKE